MKEKYEYYCKEHDFRTTDPQKALNHLKGDMVDAIFQTANKAAKVVLGIT